MNIARRGIWWKGRELPDAWGLGSQEAGGRIQWDTKTTSLNIRREQKLKGRLKCYRNVARHRDILFQSHMFCFLDFLQLVLILDLPLDLASFKHTGKQWCLLQILSSWCCYIPQSSLFHGLEILYTLHISDSCRKECSRNVISNFHRCCKL